MHHQRYNLLKKGRDEEAGTPVFLYYRRRRPNLLSVLFLSLLSCTFILAPHLFSTSSSLSQLCKLFSLLVCLFLLCFCVFYFTSMVFAGSFGVQKEGLVGNFDVNAPLCSSIPNG